MKETVISWTVVNMVTVTLMFLITSFIVGTAIKLVTKMKAKSND